MIPLQLSWGVSPLRRSMSSSLRFQPPTREEAAHLHAIFRRRRRIVHFIVSVAWIIVLVAMGLSVRFNRVWPTIIVGSVYVVGGGVLSIVLWRCPRCGLQFRQYEVTECSYCGLALLD
jgi:hypothetical protein